MIAEIITLDLIWITVLLIVGTVLHDWAKITGIKKVAVFSTSAITAAVICAYPFLM